MERVIDMSAHVACLVGLALTACGPTPARGEPCSPGDPLYVGIRGEREHYVLQCMGPPGCSGEEAFRWQEGGGFTLFVCGCDGTTYGSDPDFGGNPSVRWRWYGSCEAPCDGVGFDGEWLLDPYTRRLPPAPQCIPDCTRAVLQEDACVDAGGSPMPRECCDCIGATLDDAGQCTHGSFGFALPAFCCGA